MYRVIVSIFISLIVSCVSSPQQRVEESSEQQSTPLKQRDYQPPMPPTFMGREEDRVEYIAKNYWGNLNFRDTALLADHLTERAFAIFLQLLDSAPQTVAQEAMEEMMVRSDVDTVALERFSTLAEKYLYDPNSPFLNEERYVVVLQYLVNKSGLDEISKLRSQYQLDMALKNRVGSIATDFTLTLSGGKQLSLSQIKSDYTILFFNNPGCADCNRVKGVITSNGELFGRDNITIFAAYTDADADTDTAAWCATEYPKGWVNGYDADGVFNRDQIYDLRAIPNLYLLDREKRVLLKDSTIEQIGNYLYNYNR